jgi:hypothetical protein
MKDSTIMSENPHKKQDFLEIAKHQFARISAEFEKALEVLKDPERRKQLTSSYLDMLQKGLSKAQESVAKYQDTIASQTVTAPSKDAGAPDSSAAEQPNAAEPGSGTAQPQTPAD